MHGPVHWRPTIFFVGFRISHATASGLNQQSAFLSCVQMLLSRDIPAHAENTVTVSSFWMENMPSFVSYMLLGAFLERPEFCDPDVSQRDLRRLEGSGWSRPCLCNFTYYHERHEIALPSQGQKHWQLPCPNAFLFSPNLKKQLGIYNYALAHFQKPGIPVCICFANEGWCCHCQQLPFLLEHFLRHRTYRSPLFCCCCW